MTLQNVTRRRAAHVAGTAVVLAGLITAAGPAAAAGASCTPGIELLPTVAGAAGGVVEGFGPGGLVVGASGSGPAYWTGPEHTPHAVPLPAGFESGTVKAVSAKGLMVGTATRNSDQAVVAFAHQQGSATSQALTAPRVGDVGVDINESGRVVFVDGDVAKEWVNGKVVRELPVPADAIAGSTITSLNGINKRGDIVGTVNGSYFDHENDIMVTKTFPVVWPAGGGYPPYSLQVWNGYHASFATIGRDIDDRGRVVGLEKYHYRNDPRRTPAVWKKPYDTLPTDPGRLAAYSNDLEFNGSSPTTNVAVGTATVFEESYQSYFQAVYWTGKGAPLALPHPAGSTQNTLSRAFAATDDDRVGGTIVDRETRENHAVVWTCASKQAYAKG
ncbi:hypothetical protein ACWGHM_03400 [Streptomyces sp. NPDC054904]